MGSSVASVAVVTCWCVCNWLIGSGVTLGEALVAVFSSGGGVQALGPHVHVVIWTVSKYQCVSASLAWDGRRPAQSAW